MKTEIKEKTQHTPTKSGHSKECLHDGDSSQCQYCKPKHTPTPWIVGQNRYGTVYVATTNGNTVIDSAAVNIKNAKFIVCAVNSYHDNQEQIAFLKTAIQIKSDDWGRLQKQYKALENSHDKLKRDNEALLRALKMDHKLIECGGNCVICKVIRQAEAEKGE